MLTKSDRALDVVSAERKMDALLAKMLMTNSSVTIWELYHIHFGALLWLFTHCAEDCSWAPALVRYLPSIRRVLQTSTVTGKVTGKDLHLFPVSAAAPCPKIWCRCTDHS